MKNDFHRNSTSNSSDKYYCDLEESSLTRSLKLIAFVLFGGFGILNNTFIILLAVKYTVRKNLHHLIINMAVVDILTVLATLSEKVPFLLNVQGWTEIMNSKGNTICQILYFSLFCPLLVSYFSLFIISIQRFRATAATAQRSQPITLRHRVAELICSWLFAVIIAVEQSVFITYQQRTQEKYLCESLGEPVEIDTLLYAFVITIFFVIVILSVITLRRISNSNAIQANLSEEQRRTREKRMSGAVKMVLCSLLLYSCGFIPYIIRSIFESFQKDQPNYPRFVCYDAFIFDFLTSFLPLVNTCFGPCIYLIFLTDFREAAKKFICCRETSTDISTVKADVTPQRIQRDNLQTEETSL